MQTDTGGNANGGPADAVPEAAQPGGRRAAPRSENTVAHCKELIAALQGRVAILEEENKALRDEIKQQASDMSSRMREFESTLEALKIHS